MVLFWRQLLKASWIEWKTQTVLILFIFLIIVLHCIDIQKWLIFGAVVSGGQWGQMFKGRSSNCGGTWTDFTDRLTVEDETGAFEKCDSNGRHLCRWRRQHWPDRALNNTEAQRASIGEPSIRKWTLTHTTGKSIWKRSFQCCAVNRILHKQLDSQPCISNMHPNTGVLQAQPFSFCSFYFSVMLRVPPPYLGNEASRDPEKFQKQNPGTNYEDKQF